MDLGKVKEALKDAQSECRRYGSFELKSINEAIFEIEKYDEELVKALGLINEMSKEIYKYKINTGVKYDGTEQLLERAKEYIEC